MGYLKDTVLAFPIFISFSANVLFAQTDTTRILRDSLIIDEFRIYEYEIPFEISAEFYGMQYDVLANDRGIIRTKIWPHIGIYPCSFGSWPCTFDDVNGDGIRDIIFACLSGGNDAAEDIYIYSLDSTGHLIASFEGLDKGPWFPEDIDGDGIQEMIFHSKHYQCWRYGCSGSPAPYLVWKWDNERYKLSNLKLSDQILSKLYKIDPGDFIKEYISDENNVLKAPHDWKDDYGYPVELLRRMLTFIYSGRSDLADSMFNYHWPEYVPGKEEFYRDIADHVEIDPYWKKLQESDW